MFHLKKIIILFALAAFGCLMPIQALAANGHDHGHNHEMTMDHSAHSQHKMEGNQSTEHKSHGKCAHNGVCYMNGLCYMGAFCAILMHPCKHGAGSSGQTCSISNDCGKSSGGQGNSKSISKEFIPGAIFSQYISFTSYLLRPPKEFSLAGFTGEMEDPPRIFPLL